MLVSVVARSVGRWRKCTTRSTKLHTQKQGINLQEGVVSRSYSVRVSNNRIFCLEITKYNEQIRFICFV